MIDNLTLEMIAANARQQIRESAEESSNRTMIPPGVFLYDKDGKQIFAVATLNSDHEGVCPWTAVAQVVIASNNAKNPIPYAIGAASHILALPEGEQVRMKSVGEDPRAKEAIEISIVTGEACSNAYAFVDRSGPVMKLGPWSYDKAERGEDPCRDRAQDALKASLEGQKLREQARELAESGDVEAAKAAEEAALKHLRGFLLKGLLGAIFDGFKDALDNIEAERQQDKS
jgi:hypothetical protein